MNRASHWPLTVLGAATSLLNLFLPLMLVRIISKSDMGIYKVFYLYLAMLPNIVLSGGLNNGIGHWVGNKKTRDLHLQTTWTLLFGTAIFVIFGLLAAEHTITRKLPWDHHTFLLFVAAAALSVLYTYFEDINIATGNVWKGAIFSSTFDFTRSLSMILAGLFTRKLGYVLLAHIVVSGLKIIFGWTLGIIGNSEFYKFKINHAAIKTVLKYAIPVTASSALSVVANYSDQLYLSRHIKPDQFALYTLGCLSIPPLLIFEQSVNKVLIPQLSECFHEGQKNRAIRLFSMAMTELGWLLIPSSIGLMIFAEPIVELLFTSNYSSATIYFRIYAFIHLLNIIPFDSISRARADGKWILQSLIIFSLTSALFVYVAATHYGAMGALIGTLASLFLMRLTCLTVSVKKAQLSLRGLIPFNQLGIYLLLSLCLAALSLSVKNFFPQPLAWFLSSGAMFAVIYLGLTYPQLKKRKKTLAEYL